MTRSTTWTQATSQQMSPTHRHWPFLREVGEKGSGFQHKALEFEQKAEQRRAAGPVWKARSNCKAGRHPSEAGREVKEAQMSPWGTSPRSAASKKSRTQHDRRRGFFFFFWKAFSCLPLLLTLRMLSCLFCSHILNTILIKILLNIWCFTAALLHSSQHDNSITNQYQIFHFLK